MIYRIKIVFLVPECLLIEFDWVMGHELRWFVGPKFLLCDGFDWIGSVVWWVGLGWVGLKKLDPRITLC